MFWPEERSELAQKLWKEGLSASMIATRLGVTRNAVIGRLHRMGMTNRDTPTRRSVRSKRMHRAGKITKSRLGFTAPQELDWHRRQQKALVAFERWNNQSLPDNHTPEHERVPLLDLEHHSCRFPYGDGPFTFCGKRKVEGTTYCAFHNSRAFNPVQPERGPRVMPSAMKSTMTVKAVHPEFDMEPA